MAQRATSLGPRPSLFVFFVVFFCFFCSFPFFVLIGKPCFPPKKGIFTFIFSVSLSFSLNLFWPPPFYVSLSLSLSCSCVSFFLLVFLFAFFLFLVFVSFFIIISSLLLFHEKNNMKILNCAFFVSSIFSLFCGFLSCVSFQFPFPYLCFISSF